MLDLLRETPLRAEQKTDDHRYPLHLAVERNAPEEVIARLVEIHPEAAKVQTKKTKATALHIVRFYFLMCLFVSSPRKKICAYLFFLLSSFFFLLSSGMCDHWCTVTHRPHSWRRVVVCCKKAFEIEVRQRAPTPFGIVQRHASC